MCRTICRHSKSFLFTRITIILTAVFTPKRQQPHYLVSPPNLKQYLHSSVHPTKIFSINLSLGSAAQVNRKVTGWRLKSTVARGLFYSKNYLTLSEKIPRTSTYPQLKQDPSFWSALWRFLLWRDQSLSSTPAPPQSHHFHPRGSPCCQSRRQELGRITEERVEEIRNTHTHKVIIHNHVVAHSKQDTCLPQ